MEKDYSFHYCVFLQFKSHMFNYLKSCDLTQRWYKIFFMSAFIRKAGNQLLTLWMLGNFTWFFVVCWFFILFSKSTFLKNSFRNTIRESNCLDPDQARHFVWPDLDPNFLQRLSDETSRCWTWKYPLFLPFRTLMSSAFSSAYALLLHILQTINIDPLEQSDYSVCFEHGRVFCRAFE